MAGCVAPPAEEAPEALYDNWIEVMVIRWTVPAFFSGADVTHVSKASRGPYLSRTLGTALGSEYL